MLCWGRVSSSSGEGVRDKVFFLLLPVLVIFVFFSISAKFMFFYRFFLLCVCGLFAVFASRLSARIAFPPPFGWEPIPLLLSDVVFRQLRLEEAPLQPLLAAVP